MRVICNIPQGVYDDIIKNSTKVQSEGLLLENAILNGTVIPDGNVTVKITNTDDVTVES